VKFRHAALLPALFLAVGCFQGERAILVNPDGSGSVVDTLLPGPQLKALMEMKEAEKSKEKRQPLTGTTFVSEEKTPAGAVKLTYAFKDVNALKVDVSPSAGDDPSKKEQKSPPLSFRFKRQGSGAVLTVVQPQPSAPAAGGNLDDPSLAGLWTMLRGMLKGLKLKTTVEVKGPITHTNSLYSQGSTVTLLDLDFDQITATDDNFKKFTNAGNDWSSLDPKRLQGVSGVKVSPAPEIVIEFGGR
jgi:hypothetical protein